MKKTEMSDEVLVTKRTMEDVFKYQEKLRKLLEEMVQKNRPLELGEIDDYYYLVAHATIGLGASKILRLTVPETIEIGTVEFVARWLGRQKNNIVLVGNPGTTNYHRVPIGTLWELLLNGLFEVFPYAIEKSASMSRESDATVGGDAYGFDPNV